MSFSADRLLERIKLKSQVNIFRNICILLAVIIALLLLSKSFDFSQATQYVARLQINGVIVTSDKRVKKINELKTNSAVKALILHIDSPGGTIVGGETLYNSVRDFAKVKPVVITMGNVAASGGYMVAMGGDYIFANAGTITGSVGVILQSYNMVKLADKIGVGLTVFKSGNMKAVPNPSQEITSEQRKIVQSAIDEMQKYFLGLVKQKRKLSQEQINIISDGRIFTGKQALKNNLIDEIGGTDEALNWLKTNKNLSNDIKIRNVSVKKNNNIIDQLSTKILGKTLNSDINNMNGLMAIWKL